MANELYHYGVLGMRWGVRRTGKNGSSSEPKRVKSEDYTRAKKLKKKRLSELSNAELNDLNNRMQLESQYKNLKKQNINVGRKFVTDLVYETAKNTASSYASKYARQGIDKFVDKMMSGGFGKEKWVL